MPPPLPKKQKVTKSKDRHKCGICNAYFKTKWDCQIHIKQKHSNSGQAIHQPYTVESSSITNYFNKRSERLPSTSPEDLELECPDNNIQSESLKNVPDSVSRNENQELKSLLMNDAFVENLAKKLACKINHSNNEIINSNNIPLATTHNQILDLDDLFNRYPNAIQNDFEDSTLFCKICQDVMSRNTVSSSSSSENLSGRFKLNYPLWKTAFVIDRHNKSNVHNHCCEVLEREASANKVKASASLIVGRAWLHGAQEGDSLLRTERTLSLFSLSNDIGNIGHGRHNAKKFIADCFGEAKQRLSTYLKNKRVSTGRPPLVNLAFDKMTVLRRTLLMTAAIILYDGELCPIYLNLPPMGVELSGRSLAEMSVQVVEEFGVNLKTQLSAASVDGEILRKRGNH